VSPFAYSAADASPFLSSIAGGPLPGQSICGDRVVFVDTLLDDEIADPRVKVEIVFESTSSPPLTRRKHLGEREQKNDSVTYELAAKQGLIGYLKG
nr:hypothetical protein [Tanacetum cinerariifolium]